MPTDRANDHRAIAPMTTSVIANLLFPEGTVITEVEIDRGRDLILFYVKNADLPEVPEGLEAPQVHVAYEAITPEKRIANYVKRWS